MRHDFFVCSVLAIMFQGCTSFDSEHAEAPPQQRTVNSLHERKAPSAAKEDHEYVVPLDWDRITLADDELTRWMETNVILPQLEHRFKPMLEPEAFAKMSGTGLASFMCDTGTIVGVFDWDVDKVGISKPQMVGMISRGVQRLHAEFLKNPTLLHGGTADGASNTSAAVLAWAVWPVWEQLHADVQRKAIEILVSEAKHFEQRQRTWNYPNSNIEENSAQASLYSLIANMMPDHPLNKHWEYCTRHWTYGHVVAPAELEANPLFRDGTHLRDYVEYNPTWVWQKRLHWWTGSIHDDGSIMNHESVNPHYAMTSTCRFASQLWYDLAGRTPPDGLTTIGVQRARDYYVRMAAPWGGQITPDGFEYTPLYGAPYKPSLYLLYWHPTPEAWAAWRMTFDVVKGLVETESLVPGHDPFGEYYQAKLFPSLRPPRKILSTSQLMKRLAGVHISPTAKYVVHRSPTAYAIYSWHGFSAQGGVLDIDPVTLDKGGDGGVLVRSRREQDETFFSDRLSRQTWVKETVYGPVAEAGGFSIVVRRESKYGIVNHTAFVSLPNCNTVMVGVTRASEAMEVDNLNMGRVTFRLKNESDLAHAGLKKWPWWGDHKLYLPAGKELEFGSSEANPILNYRPAWVNIGNRMGYVSFGKSPTVGAGGQAIHFESFAGRRKVSAGEEIGRLILASFPNVTAEETARLAADVEVIQDLPRDVIGVRIPAAAGMKTPVRVFVNLGRKPVTVTLPAEPGFPDTVTVGANACKVVAPQQRRFWNRFSAGTLQTPRPILALSSAEKRRARKRELARNAENKLWIEAVNALKPGHVVPVGIDTPHTFKLTVVNPVPHKVGFKLRWLTDDDEHPAMVEPATVELKLGRRARRELTFVIDRSDPGINRLRYIWEYRKGDRMLMNDTVFVAVAKAGHYVVGPGEPPAAAMLTLDQADRVIIGAKLWQGPADCSAVASVAVDEKGLTVRVEVTDDHLHVNEDPAWNGDSVELLFDFRTEAERGRHGAAPRYTQLVIAPDLEKTRVHGVPTIFNQKIKAPGMTYTAERLADTRYRITVFIPHSATGVNLLKNPANFRFNIAVNDADSEKGRDTQLVWTGTGRNWKDPKHFGLLTQIRGRKRTESK